MTDLQFADFTWPSRWNKGEVVAVLGQSGPDVMAVGFFGTIRFRLDDDESVAAIVNSARQFADMVEQNKRKYDAAFGDPEDGPYSSRGPYDRP